MRQLRRHLAVTWLRRLVGGLSPRRPWSESGSVHMGFVVGRVALGHVSFRVLKFSLSISFHRGSPYSDIIWRINNRPVGGRSSETQSHPTNINNKGNICTWRFVSYFHFSLNNEHIFKLFLRNHYCPESDFLFTLRSLFRSVDCKTVTRFQTTLITLREHTTCRFTRSPRLYFLNKQISAPNLYNSATEKGGKLLQAGVCRP
jgi:hypothetical protein